MISWPYAYTPNGFGGLALNRSMHGNVERHAISAERSLSESVVHAVAEAEGIEPDRVASRVYDAVDPDALDRLFESPNDRIKRQDAQLSFRLDEYEVLIQGGELVMVRPRSGD